MRELTDDQLIERWGAVWWLRHRMLLDEAVGLLAAHGLVVTGQFAPLGGSEVLQFPHVPLGRAALSRADVILLAAGWQRKENGGSVWLRGRTIYRREGAMLTMGKQPRVTAVPAIASQRLVLPALEAAARITARSWPVVDFFGDLRIAPGVFEPHEHSLVQAKEALARFAGSRRVVDVGTGSGALALALAQAWPDAALLGIDASARAVTCARANARFRGAGQARFQLGDLLTGVGSGSADLVIANVSWLAPTVYMFGEATEQGWLGPVPTVVDFSADGLGLVRRLIAQCGGVLEPDGWLLLQCQNLQAARVVEHLRALRYRAVEVRAGVLIAAQAPQG